jgi:hypothetical protein
MITVLLLTFSAAQSAENSWAPPTTEDGHPDLQGTWDFGTATPWERPAALGAKRAYTDTEAAELETKAQHENSRKDAPVDLSRDAPAAGETIGGEADEMAMERRHEFTRVNGEPRTSIIIDPPDGRIPRRKDFVDHYADLAARNIQATDGPETLEAPTRCLQPLPVPSIFPMPWSALMQIVQTRDHVVLHTEMFHDARIVPLNARHSNRAWKTWMGESIGWFEGDTLVVHTINFRPEQSYAALLPMSPDFELTERFTRTGPDDILYSFTIVDPNAYTRPFTGERTLTRAAPRERILEFACHEGNYAMTGILAGARKLEQDAAR